MQIATPAASLAGKPRLQIGQPNVAAEARRRRPYTSPDKATRPGPYEETKELVTP